MVHESDAHGFSVVAHFSFMSNRYLGLDFGCLSIIFFYLFVLHFDSFNEIWKSFPLIVGHVFSFDWQLLDLSYL